MKKMYIWIAVIGIGAVLVWKWKWIANQFGLYSETSDTAY